MKISRGHFCVWTEISLKSRIKAREFWDWGFTSHLQCKIKVLRLENCGKNNMYSLLNRNKDIPSGSRCSCIHNTARSGNGSCAGSAGMSRTGTESHRFHCSAGIYTPGCGAFGPCSNYRGNCREASLGGLQLDSNPFACPFFLPPHFPSRCVLKNKDKISVWVLNIQRPVP